MVWYASIMSVELSEVFQMDKQSSCPTTDGRPKLVESPEKNRFAKKIGLGIRMGQVGLVGSRFKVSAC